MTIYRTPYDTTIMAGYRTRNIIDGIQKARNQYSELLHPVSKHGIREVVSDGLHDAIIPIFHHPIAVPNDIIKDEVNYDDVNSFHVYVDARRYSKTDRNSWDTTYTNTLESYLSNTRGALNSIWLKHGPAMLRQVDTLPNYIYACWISEGVGQRFALGAQQQYRLMILSALMYQCLFIEDDEYTDQVKNRIAMAITKATKVKAEDVFEVIDICGGPVSSVDRFCDVAAEVTESVRLKELNTGLLYMIVQGSWLKTTTEEVAAVALEHPPTWQAMCLASIAVRGFHKVRIAQVATRMGSAATKQMTQSLERLIKDYAE